MPPKKLKELSKLTVVCPTESEYREACPGSKMTDPDRKTQASATEGQTVLNEIRYLDSPTDYREYLPGTQQSDFVVLDDMSGFDRRGLRDLALIAFLVLIILLLALRA